MTVQENSSEMELEQLSLDDFVIQNELGSGSFGKVFKVRSKKNNEIYAAKISHEELEDSPEMKLDISREVSILSKLNHPSVLKFIYFSPTNFKKKPKPVIITEYASNGTLEDFIRVRQPAKDSNLNNNDKPPQSNVKQKIVEGKEQNVNLNLISESQSNVKQVKIEEEKEQSVNSNLNSESQSNAKQVKIEEEKEQNVNLNLNSESQSNTKQEKIEEEKEQCANLNLNSESQSNAKQEKIEEEKEQSENLNLNSESQSNAKQEKIEEEKEQCANLNLNSESNTKQEKIEDQNESSSNDKAPNLMTESLSNMKQEDLTKEKDYIVLDSLSDPRLDDIIRKSWIGDDHPNEQSSDFINELLRDDSDSDFDETHKLIAVYGIASAMAYLHKHDIIHRDLKPANILMDDFLFPKIADFGLSKITTIEKVDSVIKSTQGSIKGTPIYMAPEIWQNVEYSKASDVYAFGLILYELYTQNKPFKGCNVFQIPLMLLKKYRPKFDKEIPQVYKDLIIRCWSEDPKQRPTFEQIADELKNNSEYITSKVNKKEFLIYVNYIEEQQSSFEISKNVDLDSIFGQIKINQQESYNKRKSLLLFFPFEMFNQLKHRESINLVLEARNDPNKLFRLAQCVIEGESDFPQNVQLGIKYLRQLIDTNDLNICKEALIYYLRILIKGDIIPFNEKLVNKLLDKFFNEDKSIYYLFKGKLSKKKGDYEQAQTYFDISIRDKNLESAYEYCKIYFKNNTLSKQEEDSVVNLLKKLISLNFIPASYKYGKYLMFKKEGQFQEGFQHILNAANKGHIKSCYLVGNVFYSNKKLDESIRYYKVAANKGHIKSIICLAAFSRSKEMLLFKKAANKGDLQSIYYYGYMLKDRQKAARYVKIAADNGCDSAMVTYGRMLRLGDGVPADSNEAVRYYKMAIDRGNKYGMTQYAHMLKHGDGIPANPTEAVKYYKMAIEKGDSSAMNDYGHMLKNGIGVEKNYPEAIKYYKMAIDKGHLAAANNYGYMLFSGEGVEKNYDEAIKYFKIAIEGGEPEAMHTYAHMLMKGIGVEKNIPEAIKYLKMAISKGLAKAMNTYALLLKTGNGVSVNYHEAARYYKMSIEKGNGAAMYNYAKMLEKGNGISINIPEAIKYYNMAAANGYPIAMNDLGLIYLAGTGVEVNYEEAAKCFRSAARCGNVNSMLSYASMLENGQGCQANPEEAIKYYKLAISKGSGKAMYKYGLMLHKGIGVKQNIEEAIKYYQLAFQHGEYEGFLALSLIQMGADIPTDE